MAFTRLPPALHANLADTTGADHHADLPSLASVVDQILVVGGGNLFEVHNEATQIIMEAGTDSLTRGMSALGVGQAISSQHFALATLFSS